MMMRLMIDRDSYRRFVSKGRANGVYVLNDLVSSTRHDPARVEHRYWSRWDLLRSAISAEGGQGVLVRLVDDMHYERPIIGYVTAVGQMCGDGLRFPVNVAGGPATARRRDGGGK